MIEGIRHSRADKVLWRHNDWRDLERKLLAVGDRPKIVAFERVNSMDGDIAPIREIIEVCEANGRCPVLLRFSVGHVWPKWRRCGDRVGAGAETQRG